MSRIGKLPVAVPEGVKCVIEGQSLKVSGKLGELSYSLPKEVTIVLEDGKLKIVPINLSTKARAMWGLSRSLVNNMVIGVSQGFEIKLEITGVGYKALVDGKYVILSLGHSHDIIYDIPEGITVKADKPTNVSIFGYDKQKVGEVAATLIKLRPPEPYKGKGVNKAGNKIRRKEGKKK